MERTARKTSEAIGRQVRHITGLVEDLHDVSRVTRGLVKLGQVALDVLDAVNEAVEYATPPIRARGLELLARHAA